MDGVTVIIPSHNRVDLLTRALDSVLHQEGNAMKMDIIVVDDGSTDGTADMVRACYPEVDCIVQGHAGVSAARNTGILAANHDWIALLDSDDAWLPHKLASQRIYLETNPGYRLAHCDEIWIRRGVRVNPKKKHQKRGGFIFRDCLPLCVISPSSVLLHKSLLDEVGMFDETLPACEDYDLWLRVCSRYPVLYTKKKLVTKFGGHADQLSQRHWGLDRFRIRSIAGLLRRNELNPADLSCAIDTMHQKIHLYLAGARKHNNSECVMEFESLLADYPLQ